MMTSVDFPLLRAHPALRYLDNAATMHKPACMLAALQNFYTTDYGTVHRGIYQHSEGATAAYARARVIIAQWLGVDAQQVVFTAGATAALNMVAQGLAATYLRPNDEIIITLLEHHANILPWRRIAQQIGCKLHVIPVQDDLQLDENTYRKLLSSRTKIVALTHVANSVGTVLPIQRLANQAHAVGALVVVDCAQSVGHMPVTLSSLNADFIAFSGHKIGGPTGIGILAGTPAALALLEPVFLGGGAVRVVTADHYELLEVPERLEAGTPPIAQAIALGVTIQYWQEHVAYTALHQHYQRCMQLLVHALQELPQVRILGDWHKLQQESHIVSFVHAHWHPHDIAAALDQEHIAVRAGTHCAQPLFEHLAVHGSVRLSLAPYTTIEDIEYTLAALRRILR